MSILEYIRNGQEEKEVRYRRLSVIPGIQEPSVGLYSQCP
jgi:hypothetical protein